MDINDLTIVLANFGQTGMAWSQGNFTGDPTVDINDLTIVLSNYGYGVTAAAGVKAVPEPASLVLLLAALVCLVGPVCRTGQWRPAAGRGIDVLRRGRLSWQRVPPRGQ